MVENGLLITVDSLRYDHYRPADVGLELGEEAVHFDSAYATGPRTTSSFPGVLCGSLPLSYGGLGPLTEDRPRLARQLREAGFATGGFQCNPFLSRHFGYDEGFEAYEDYQNPLMGIATRLFPRGIERGNSKLSRVDDYLHLTDGIKKAYQVLKGKPRPYVSADVVTDDAIDWLSETDEPFFGWVHYMDVHHPCFPPEPYRERHGVTDVTQSEVADWYPDFVNGSDRITDDQIRVLLDLYRAAVDYTEDQVARLVDHLRETGRYDETMVVLTSDHGELFGEHGEYSKPARMYDELLHVPLLVANGPDRFEAASGDLVSLLDVPPMFHDALGVAIPETYEGVVPSSSREYVQAEHEEEGQVVVGARSRDWLYEGDEIRGEHGLFDCRDGFERASMDAAETEAEAATVRDAVLDRLGALDVDAGRLEEAVSGDVENRLEDLGYLQ